MIRAVAPSRRIGRFAAAALLFALAGCGWAEWPASGRAVTAATPAAAAPAAAETSGAVVIRKGDSVYALAKRHGVSMRGIIDANGLKPPYTLYVGRSLVLPSETRHRVAEGDTLGAIARRYDTDPYEIARANDLRPPYPVAPGRSLLIPRRGTVAPATRAEAPAPPATPAGTVTVEAAPAPSAPSQPAPATEPPPPVAVARPATPVSVPAPPALGGGGFAWPLRGQVISAFGAKDGGLHNDGINIAAPRGTPVTAAENGVVAYVGNELRGFGNLILLKHADGWMTAYAHADTVVVKRGDRVTRGQPIARVGSTGSVRTPQLHFEIRRGKEPLDPQAILARNEA